MLPRSFGPYVLFDFVGKGGMAETYLARQKMQLGGTRLCVIKQILPSLAADRQFSDMLVQEAKLAARLSHANLVEVLHLGREDGRLFIAMEYVEGFDLNCLLGRLSRARVPLALEFSLYIVAETLRGLDYAHRRRDDMGAPLRLVHRDVSPSNLLVSFEGEVKLCDFGIARANDQVGVPREVEHTHELEEALRGKAGYMSPEHARGEAVDARADVFAAGIVLWELTAGRRMYKRRDGGPSLLELARRADVPQLDTTNITGEQARGLHAILGKALAVDREQRYASAGAMLRDLEAYVGGAKLMTSGPAFGQWLTRTLGEEIIARRRSRERAVAALERGAPLVMEPIASLPMPPVIAAEPVPGDRHVAAPRARRGISRIAFVAMALLTLAAAVLTNTMR